MQLYTVYFGDLKLLWSVANSCFQILPEANQKLQKLRKFACCGGSITSDHGELRRSPRPHPIFLPLVGCPSTQHTPVSSPKYQKNEKLGLWISSSAFSFVYLMLDNDRPTSCFRYFMTRILTQKQSHSIYENRKYPL